MSEFKYTKDQVIEQIKDALSFVEQCQWHSYDSPWKENETVQKHIDDAADYVESAIDMLKYTLEEE